MFIINQTDRILNEANEKALTPICTVHVQRIFALLHAQAVTAARKLGVIIENTAAAGNDEKNAVFHSAGEHMIVGRLAKDKDKDKDNKEQDPEKAAEDEKTTIIKGIKEYIGVFCGKDVKDKLKDDDFLPLPEESDADQDSGAGNADDDDDEGEETGDEESDGQTNESGVGFMKYMKKHTSLKSVLEAEDNDPDADEAGDEEDADEAGDEEDEDKAGDEEDEDKAGEKEDKDKAGDDDDDDDDDDKKKKQKVPGYYILYGLKIKGLKETTVADALKQWGSNFLKGFGVKLGSMWGGGGGEAHTLGGLVHGMKELFGAITDPEELVRRVKETLVKKFPNVTNADCEFRDKNTLISELNSKSYSEGWPDGKNKQKIKSADYSMVITVDGSAVQGPFINRKLLANIVTMQIKGLFKKFKNLVKADDIIYLKGGKLDGKDVTNIWQKQAGDMMSIDKLLSKEHMNIQFDASNFADITQETDAQFTSMISKLISKYKDNNEKLQEMLMAWQSFYKKHTPSGATSNNVKFKISKDDFKKEFIDKYVKIRNDIYTKAGSTPPDDKEIHESVYVAYDIMRDLFENQIDCDKLTDIYSDSEDMLVLSEKDDKEKEGAEKSDGEKSGGDSNDADFESLKHKLQGPVMNRIVSIANDACQKKLNKVQFTAGMAKFARVDINICQNIKTCEGFGYNLIDDEALKTAESGKYKYFILAYFKIPKEIEDSKIRGKKKKKVNEVDYFGETEDIDEGLVINYIKKNRLTQEQALSDEEIEKMRGLFKKKASVDKVKADIATYFEKLGGRTPAKAGHTWKGTPGQEGFTPENMKAAFELAVDGEIEDFRRYTVPNSSPKFSYNDTKVPSDVDVFIGFTSDLKGGGNPPEEQKKKMYFVVTKDPLNPKPDEIQIYLNDKKPVTREEFPGLDKKLQAEAIDYLSTGEGKNLIKESTAFDYDWIFEDDPEKQAKDAEKPTEKPGEEKPTQSGNSEQTVSDIQFVEWTPDPLKQEYVNGKGPDGKDAIIICAKLKKEQDPGKKPGEDPTDDDDDDDEDDDKTSSNTETYIIPMPGVSYNGSNNKDDFKGAGEDER